MFPAAEIPRRESLPDASGRVGAQRVSHISWNACHDMFAAVRLLAGTSLRFPFPIFD